MLFHLSQAKEKKNQTRSSRQHAMQKAGHSDSIKRKIFLV